MEPLPITTEDSHRFQARWHTSLQSQTKATFIIFPALGVGARYYDPFAQALAEAGVNACISELRGQETSSLRASRQCNWGYEDAVTQDWPAVLAAVRKQAPNGPLYLFGHSLGGQLSCLFQSTHPDAADGVIVFASGTVYFRNWPSPMRWKLLLQTQMVAVISLALGYFPGKRIGFGGLQACREMLDWSSNARNGGYWLHNSHVDYPEKMASFRGPVWAFTLAGDDMAPPAAILHLVGKFRSAQVIHKHLTREDLPPECLHHFAWARNPGPVVTRILAEVGL